MMKKRTCDTCGKPKPLSGGAVCPKGHFTCKDCAYGHKHCKLCGHKLRGPLSGESARPARQADPSFPLTESSDFEYDIAFSFAGEDRSIVEQLASKLKEEGVRVFYDAYEKAALWGKDLYQHLQIVYRDRARYCVVFVSASYADKLWTRHELKQAQTRAFKERREYILPVRLDDTEIPGLNATTGYIDLRQHTVEDLQKVILQKLFGEDVNNEDLPELTWRGDLVGFRGTKVASFWPAKLARAQIETTYTVDIPRIRYGEEASDLHGDKVQCHDCGAVKGECHVPGCDVEECPVCRGQALGCEHIIG